MGKDSNISWTNHTFNPWWGCTKIAAGCKHCYAETLANRFGLAWGGQNLRLFGDKHWREPLKWDREAKAAGTRARVFCGSMCDVGELREGKAGEAMDEARARLWKLVEATPNLDWLLLTKRPANLRRVLPTIPFCGDELPRFDNVWAGTTVCTQADLANVLELVSIPAKVHFVSAEPLLEELDFRRIEVVKAKPPHGPGVHLDALTGHVAGPDDVLPKVDWVIIGGESGSHARPMRVEWMRSLVRQCREAGVATWVKQLGARPVFESVDDLDDETWRMLDADGWQNIEIRQAVREGTIRLRDRAGADMAEWPSDLRVREMPKP